MPVEIDILEFQCLNQLRNGEDFSQNTSDVTVNLVGNVGEKVRLIYQAILQQTAFASDTEEWFIDLDNLEITRSSGSFLADSIQVGDFFNFYANWETRKALASTFEYQGAVEFISSDGTVMQFSVRAGVPVSVGVKNNVGMVFDQIEPTNKSEAVFLKFGLLSTDETFNYLSKVTESQQVYYAGDISTIPQDAESLGLIKDWVSGNLNLFSGAVNSGFFGLKFTFYQDFIINPFYILDFRENILNGTVPELLEGDNSLKYAAEIEFRKSLTNTGSSKTKSFDSLEGFVGWYGENFNGLNPDYELISVAYEDDATGDPLDAININLATKITITVGLIGGSITGYSCGVYLFKVPASEDEYQGTSTGLVENFLYKFETITSPATSSTNVQTSLVGGKLVIEYTVDYLTAEKLRLSTDDEFMISVQVEDPTTSAGSSDRMMLIADLRNYVDVDFLAGFVDVANYGFLSHGQELNETDGVSALTVSDEDGILLNATIGTDVTKDVVINAVTAKLIAYNSVENKSFEIDSYPFNLGPLVVNGGFQQIELDTTRGYSLVAGDDFNSVKVTNKTQVGVFQQYLVLLGQKIKWQEWINNPAVDDVFFDSSQPNNNLNKKASNYSNKEGYVIKLALVVNVTGVDDLGRTLSGDVTIFGGSLKVEDYDESEDGVTGTIQTFDVESGNSLDGDILYNGKDTLFKTVFLGASAMQFGLHRIEVSQSPGDGIVELSSLPLPTFDSLLKPLAGESQLKFEQSGGTITTSCLIDGGLVQEGAAYKLSARTGVYIPPQPFEMEVITTNAGSASDTMILPFVGATNCNVDWGDGNDEDVVAAGDLTHVYAVGGTYTIRILGLDYGFVFDGLGDKAKVGDISKWGDFVIKSKAFSKCTFLTTSATDPATVAGLEETFRNCVSLVGNDSWKDWVLPSSPPMSTLTLAFHICPNFNGNISTWNFSGAVALQFFMTQCASFAGSLPQFSTDPMTSVATAFNQVNLLDEDFSYMDFTAVTTMAGMLSLTNLSSANYNALLAKIRADAEGPGITNGMPFGADGLVATGQGVTDRTWLIANTSMTIIDATP